MAHVFEINDWDDLEPYRLQWRSLVGQTREATFCQTLEWLKPYWSAFAARRRLRVLMAFSSGQLIGIVPLCSQSLATPIGFVRRLTYPVQTASHYGPIGPNPTATLVTALRYLTARQDWDLLDLPGIAPEVDAGRTRFAMRRAGLQGRQGRWQTATRIECAASWEQFIAARGQKFARRLAGVERAAARAAVCLERHRPQGSMHADDDPRWDLLHECLDAARSDGDPSAGDRFAPAVAAVRSCRELHAAAASAGGLDLTVLRSRGRIVAFAYNYCWNGSLQCLWSWVDERGLVSPTDFWFLLCAGMLRDSCHRGDRVLYFSPHDHIQTSEWASRRETTYRCSHYSFSSPASQLLRLQRWLSSQLRGTDKAGEDQLAS